MLKKINVFSVVAAGMTSSYLSKNEAEKAQAVLSDFNITSTLTAEKRDATITLTPKEAEATEAGTPESTDVELPESQNWQAEAEVPVAQEAPRKTVR